MKQDVIARRAYAVRAAALIGCSSMESTASTLSAFENSGETSNVSSIAGDFVNSSF